MLERVMSFLTTSPSLAEITSLTWFRGQPRQWRSGKDISLGTTCPIGHMFGTLSAPERKPPSCGPFGTKVVAINEWDARIATTSILGQCFICLVNTSGSIKHKTRDCIQAKTLWWRATFVMHELQWGPGLATMTTLIGSKPSLVKKSPKICQVSFYWHLLGGSPFGQFKLIGTTRSLTKYDGMKPRSNTSFGATLSCTWKTAWVMIITLVEIKPFSVEALHQDFGQPWCFVEEIMWRLCGTGSADIVRF